jgi:tripartite-type tricarboxylate transporter receptor subunit TctC
MSQTILVATPSMPAATLDEFIALAKRQPGKMSFGVARITPPGHPRI